MGYVEEICDDIALIHRGDILLTGSSDIKRDMGENKLRLETGHFKRRGCAGH